MSNDELERGVTRRQASTVARALVRLSAQPATGTRVVPSDELQQLGR